MATQSAINPAPSVITPIFIPENWNIITANSSSSTSTTTSTKIVGEIISYTGTTLPSSNWLWCNGASYLPSTYNDLYNMIGYTYGSSSVGNPSSSAVSLGYDLTYPTTSITKTTTSQTQTNQNRNFFQVTIPSNTDGGGSFSFSTPLYVTNAGSFGPLSSTLTITTTFSSVTFAVYKDGTFFSTGTATPNSGAVNPFVFQVVGNSTSLNFSANNYIGNYSCSFTPAVQSTSSTYLIRIILQYTTSSNVTGGGGSTTYNNTMTPSINSSISSFPTTAVNNDGTISITSATPTGYSAVSYTWNGNTLFTVPNLCSRTPIGSDSNSVLTTTYQGSSVAIGGNRNMTINQLGQHNHAINSVTPTGMLQNLNQNSAIQGIGAGTEDIVKSGLGSGATYTASAGNAGNSADLLPPFNVCNFLIRAN